MGGTAGRGQACRSRRNGHRSHRFLHVLQLLPRRLRKIATFLANGETTGAAAKRFRLSQARISQIRKELFLAWHRFQGDEPVIAVA